ncbi:hypothetical protein [Halopseudomonas aestusnigri]|uniref:hypothetical protein n=1 Tax=Halopseudomonas aestusnigri TaxID=857252 RepID=UPI0028C20789|nr:hypothetical protein YSKK_13290 [Halopseudomonas aestusnigri]
MSGQLIHISIAKCYQFKGITFEWHDYLGPTFLRRKDLEMKPQLQRPMREYGLLGQWLRLSPKDRETYRL